MGIIKVKMTKINHGGAFIPVIPLSGSLIGTKREQFTFVTGRQNFLQIKNDQNCSKFRGHFLSTALNSKSEQQITEELLNDLSFEKKDSKNLNSKVFRLFFFNLDLFSQSLSLLKINNLLYFFRRSQLLKLLLGVIEILIKKSASDSDNKGVSKKFILLLILA